MTVRHKQADGTAAPPRRLSAAQQRLVVQWMWLAPKVVSVLGVPAYLRADATAEATWALCRAALRYDPASGVKFVTYAFRAIVYQLAGQARAGRGGGHWLHQQARHEHLPLPSETIDGEDVVPLFDSRRGPAELAEECDGHEHARRRLDAVLADLTGRERALLLRPTPKGLPADRRDARRAKRTRLIARLRRILNSEF